VINLRESCFSRILKGEGGYWVPETLVEQSKTRNEHGSGTQIVTQEVQCRLQTLIVGKCDVQLKLKIK
jgi:hypothetical protein